MMVKARETHFEMATIYIIWKSFFLLSCSNIIAFFWFYDCWMVSCVRIAWLAEREREWKDHGFNIFIWSMNAWHTKCLNLVKVNVLSFASASSSSSSSTSLRVKADIYSQPLRIFVIAFSMVWVYQLSAVSFCNETFVDRGF